MSNLVLRIKQDNAGSIGILFSLIAVPVVAVVGAAIDYGMALNARTELQAAVDMAAAAGARLPATSNQNRTEAVLASFNAGVAGRNFTASTPKIDASNSKVAVVASASVPTSFMGILGFMSLTVSAETEARSQIENGGVACLVALNPNAPEGLHMQGINKFASQDCWAWVNSTSSESINADGAAEGFAQGFCTAGGVVGPEHFHPSPFTECDPMEDPFKGKISAPSTYSCDYTNERLQNGSHSLQPGVYCGGLELKPQAIATMEPGVYVIKDGSLTVQAESSLTGTGVTIYFVGNQADLDLRGGGSMVVKAPADGDYAGFVMIQDEYSNPGEVVEIRGGGDLKIEGIMYMPTWQVLVSGNGELNQGADYFAMVADSFHMEGNGRIHIKSDAEAAGLPNHMPRIKNGPVLLK